MSDKKMVATVRFSKKDFARGVNDALCLRPLVRAVREAASSLKSHDQARPKTRARDVVDGRSTKG